MTGELKETGQDVASLQMRLGEADVLYYTTNTNTYTMLYCTVLYNNTGAGGRPGSERESEGRGPRAEGLCEWRGRSAGHPGRRGACYASSYVSM